MSSSSQSRETNGTSEVDDPESLMSAVARCLELLHAAMSSSSEKEAITVQLLELAKSKAARLLIGSHSLAMPIFVSVLRNGTHAARANVAAILCYLCKEDDLRVRVLLGGCIPPLLSLLKSESAKTKKAAAEAIFEVSSGGLSDDHIGMKIFVTEGVVPTLWEMLNPRSKQDKIVEGFVSGALRNLCSDKHVYWRATLEAGGVEILTGLLSSDNVAAQSNAASLLARVTLAFGDSVPKFIDAGAVKALLQFLSQKNEISVRASAADALEALSRSDVAKQAIVDGGGLPVLIRSVVAPSKECMQGENCHALQHHSVHALGNICGSMTSLIIYLGELSQSPPSSISLSDILGALAYTLMVLDGKDTSFDPIKIEIILITLLKPKNSKQVQDCLLEALSSLYGNSCLFNKLYNSDAKKVLVSLITLASADVQEQLILFLTRLCCDGVTIWDALGKREGMQLLVSLLGLSSEQHQEYAVSLLAILTSQIDESKWAITAAGGIPPLVQLLETGSQKAKEDAAYVLWNLCCYNNDIRACVDSAGAVSALLWLLNSGSSGGQEASAKALKNLITFADSAITNQLLALLLNESPTSKCHVISVLGHVLILASKRDLLQDGSPGNKGLMSLVHALDSTKVETQEYAATILADIFIEREDICDFLAVEEIVRSFVKLLTSKNQVIATQSARALGALSRPCCASGDIMSYISKHDVKHLIEMAKLSSIDAAEAAVAALANFLADPEIAKSALDEDIVVALTRILKEGTLGGKKMVFRSLQQLLLHFSPADIHLDYSQCQFVILELLDSLSGMEMDATMLDPLDLLSLMVRKKEWTSGDASWNFISGKLLPLVRCVEIGFPPVQAKSIEILSRLCEDQTTLVGGYLAKMQGSISSLAKRVIESTDADVKNGGIVLLICTLEEHSKSSIDLLNAAGLLENLIYSLVSVLSQSYTCGSLEIELWKPCTERHLDCHKFGEDRDAAKYSGGASVLWLLALICSHHAESKLVVMKSGGLEMLLDKLGSSTARQKTECENMDEIWTTLLLLAILFQDLKTVHSSVMHALPSLVSLLHSDALVNRYLSAQSLASLVCSEDKVLQLAVANSGAIGGIINLIGHVEYDMPERVSMFEKFQLTKNPAQVILQHLFELEDIRNGAVARKAIPLLVDLLRPMPDRPGAPLVALCLLTELAEVCDANKVVMAEHGALDALTMYLSLGPQNQTETMIIDLLRVLYSKSDLLYHESTLNTLNQLLAVLRLGSRNSRLSAVRTLEELFYSNDIRDSEMAMLAIQPLVDMLHAGSELEQHAGLAALIKLTSGNMSKASVLIDLEGNSLESLYKILISTNSSIELKKNAAQLCYVLFGNPSLRSSPVGSKCVQPLISLLTSDSSFVVEPAICALDRLLEEEQNADAAATYEVIDILVRAISGKNYRMSEASVNLLIKLGKDRPHCKLEMVKAGIVENALDMIVHAPISIRSSIAELFRILTNNSGIAKSSVAARMVEPLFSVLQLPDITMWGQHSALQALVNILEKPQSLKNLKLTPSQVIEPLIPFLESPSQAIQQLGTEVLSHLLEQEHFQQDITTKNAVVPLVQLAGIGILSLQQTAVKALESISVSWPKAVADAGGILELSKVITQEDPKPTQTLWESAALVLSNVLRYSSDNYVNVSISVLVRLLSSTVESTVTIALSALLVQEKSSSKRAVAMADAGAIGALLHVLRSHQCEEAAARLLEGLLNNTRVRDMKVSKYAIGPLSQYLLDPQSRCQSAKFLVIIALGDLFQHQAFSKTNDAVSACRALICILEDQPTEDMAMVAICALQSLVMNSRTNRRAVAEAGGILIVQELLLSSNMEISGQAALLIKYLFSNHTLQEYVSNELIRSLTAALERDLLSTSSVNAEVLKTIHVIFTNFKKLRTSEAATLCIPHLVSALKSRSETAQETVLDTLCLLKESWPQMNDDIAKAQALTAAEAIPVLQSLMKTCPPSFHERADSLLHCLPGCLTVTVKRGNNLKQTMGSPNAFCCLKIGNGPPLQTKVVHNCSSPEWEESFTWAFDVPPKGQKLYVLCKSKNTFGKSTLGRVTFQIDKVVTEGVYGGLFSISHDGSKDSSRTLEIEIVWSNRTSSDAM